MSRSRLIILGIVVSVLAGCYTGGAYIKEDEFAKLQENIRTAEQLEQALGTPTVTVPRDDGKIMWVYQGIHKSANALTYVPYLNFLASGNDKECTRLTVLVERDSGKLSDWQYSAVTDSEFWAKTSDKCSSGKRKANSQPRTTGDSTPSK